MRAEPSKNPSSLNNTNRWCRWKFQVMKVHHEVSSKQVTTSCQVNVNCIEKSTCSKIRVKRTRVLPNQIHQPESFNLTWKRKYVFFVPWKNIVITPGPSNCCKTLWQFIICYCRRDPSRNRYTRENEWMSPKKEPFSKGITSSNFQPSIFREKNLARFQGFQLLISSDSKRRCGEVFPMYLFQCEDQLSQLTTWAWVRDPISVWKFFGGDPNPYWSTENNLRHTICWWFRNPKANHRLGY